MGNMLKAELKAKINQLWDRFWAGGLANPLTAIEQVSYLIFIKRLEELDEINKNRASFFACPALFNSLSSFPLLSQRKEPWAGKRTGTVRSTTSRAARKFPCIRPAAQ